MYVYVRTHVTICMHVEDIIIHYGSYSVNVYNRKLFSHYI